MATIRRIFAGALLVLGMVVLGATTAWLLVEDATLVSLLVKRLETASDTRISYLEGATISRTWAPELIFSDLVVDDSEGRYRFETSSLQLKVSLPSLLAGRVDIPHLLLGNTRVHTRKSATAAAPDVAERPPLDLSALRLRPVLHEMQIAELSLVVEGEEFQLPMTRVSGLSVRMDTEANVARLSAELELADETFSIKATLPVLAQALKRNELPFSVWVQGTMTESSAVGQIDFGQPVAVLEAELKGRFPDLNRVPGLNGQLSIPGELTASALLSGPVDQLAVKDLVADWTGPGQSGAKLSGQIANVAKFEGAELALAGQLAHPDWLTAILPASLGALNSADLAARISGDLTRLTLQAFDFQARSTDELDLSLTGQLDLVQPLQALEAENLDLKLAFSAPTTRAARILIFDDIPEFGAISGAADIHSTRGEPALDNIGIQIRDESGIEVDLSGRIAQFPLSDAPNTGYDLDVSMKADQTALMAERAGLELPLAGPLDLSYRIEGDTQALELNQIKLAAGDKSQTLVGAEGRLHFGDWDQPDPIESMDLTVRMSGRDTGFVSAFTKQELPALAYQSQARLHTVDGQHRVDDYKLTTPKGEPLDVWEKGSADKVTFLPAFSMEGIRLDHRARTDDVAKLNALFKLDGKIPAVGRLDMRAIITGTDRKLLIDQLELSAGDEDVLRVRANGRLGYISAEKKWRLENTDLELEARSSSSQALAQAFGYEIPDLGPVEAQSSIHDRDKTLRHRRSAPAGR